MKPITSKMLEDARTGFQTLYDGTFNAYTPEYSKIAMDQPSSGAAENYSWLGDIPQIREWAGERYIHNLLAHDYTIVNKDYELTIGVDRNHIMDDKLGTYSNRFKGMGEQAAKHPDKLVFELLARGHQEYCYDGQFFFDTDHPVDMGNGNVESQSNSFSGAAAPWFLLSTNSVIKPIIYQKRQDYNFVALDDPRDTRVFFNKQFIYGCDGRSNVGFSLWQLAVRSTKALDKTGYKEARDALQGRKNASGPLGLKGNILVVGQENESAAWEVVKAERDAAGATNIYRDTTEVYVCPWL